MIQSGLRKFVAAHTKLPHHSFPTLFRFLRIYFVSFKLFFYQIYYVLSNHKNFGQEGGRAGINKNVTDTKRDRRGVTTDLGGGQGRNKQKRYRHKT